MAIIVSRNGKQATKIHKTPFGLEDHLQKYIYDNPESIPLYDIKEDVQLLILAREFSTLSGPIDAIGIDRDGELYLVETKLYKNPDKRTVVAQVLDYGASLWKSHPEFDSFISQLNIHTQKAFGQTAREKMQSFFSLDDTQADALLHAMSENLDGGNFKFVVLMDTIHDQLKDLILYMNQNSKFDIYGVELEYYKHDEFEIIIPKLFGAEVKKDVAAKKIDTTFISDEEFISLYTSIGLTRQIEDVLKLEKDMEKGIISYSGWVGRRTPKNISFTYTAPGREGQSLTLSLGYNKGTPSDTIDFWLYDKSIEEKIIAVATSLLHTPVKKLLPEAKYGVVVRLPLKEFTTEKLTAFFAAL